MAKKPELRQTSNGAEVWAGGKLVGSYHRVGPNDYAWHSRMAVPPMHQGRCKDEGLALAHLGYKRVRGK